MKKTLITILLLSTSFSLACCGTEQKATSYRDSYGVFIRLGEGQWSVEDYQQISSQIMNIRFEYPVGWGGTIYQFDSRDGEYEEVFGDASVADEMPESVDKYIGVTVYRDSPINTVELPSSEMLVETQKIISFAGVMCVDNDYGTGSDARYFRSIDGNNGRHLIMIQFDYESDRTVEEYRAVIDRILNTFEIDFEKDLAVSVP